MSLSTSIKSYRTRSPTFPSSAVVLSYGNPPNYYYHSPAFRKYFCRFSALHARERLWRERNQ